jgi:prepilin-type N-terminal cleavage/methylation domain-containing protein
MRRRAPYRVQAAAPRGYTLVELVVVLGVAAVLSAYIAPRFWTQQTFNDRGYVDELAEALRSTQKAAVITGCPAQLSLTPASYVATQQASSGNTCNPSDTSWAMPVLSADGSAIKDIAPANTTAGPAGVYQFDAQGRLSSSPAASLTVGTHTITIVAGNGFVQVQ